MTERRLVSLAILDILEWVDNPNAEESEWKQGIIMGLKIAQQIAVEVERGNGDGEHE